MFRLRQHDLAAFSRGLALLYSNAQADTLCDRVLACLRGVFSCEFASFSLMDLRGGRFHHFVLSPDLPEWPGTESYQRHLGSDPGAAYIRRTRDPTALKTSDLLSLRRYRETSVYREVFAKVGCDRRLGFAVARSAPVSLTCTLNRKGRDFSEEERGLLDLLRPHLIQANAQVQAQRRANVYGEADCSKLGDVFGVGIGEIDTAGRIHRLNPRAAALLRDFFPVKRRRAALGHLPLELELQLAPVLRPTLGDASAALLEPTAAVWRFAGPESRRLEVRLMRSLSPRRWQLLLEESNPAKLNRPLAEALALTPRQAEILHWLTEGKTNWEIGSILGITEKTASKHLETVFAKLHVENRTAAARVALEARANL